MESIDIKVTVNQCANRNADSFRVLYEHLIDKIFAFVVFRVNNREAAKDVTQDIFIELYQVIPKFRYHSDAAFYAYVFTIARRQIIKRYKDEKKHQTTAFAEDSVPGEFSNVEIKHSIHTALEALDECSREIMVLHHWSRFTFAEIGALINMTESAVRVRHHRARSTLLSLLNS
ncbi:MAG: sigma-70 family RNA polymerase sigma factor [Patescibacteria group bacterium]